MLGDHERAQRLASTAQERVAGVAPLSTAEALVVQGRIAADAGDLVEARARYQAAIRVLNGAGADRLTGELWFEVADLLDDLGEHDDARRAYRSAAASAGLAVRASRRTLDGANPVVQLQN
jgi:tetratricopeptide (TPR) repeat protein